jgi:hypothetical protein
LERGCGLRQEVSLGLIAGMIRSVEFLSGVPGRLVGGLSLQGEEPSMLAEVHRVLRIITHRHHAAEQDETIGKLPSMRRRHVWARAVHQLLDAGSRYHCSWWQGPHPYWDFPPLTRREVVWACRPALLAIAAALCDERQPISAVALRQLKRFLTDPAVSPLFGDDPLAARQVARQLQCSFTGHPEP